MQKWKTQKQKVEMHYAFLKLEVSSQANSMLCRYSQCDLALLNVKLHAIKNKIVATQHPTLI